LFKDIFRGYDFYSLNGDFAPWVGALIADVEQNPLLLVTPECKERQKLITDLSRVGFDGTIGF